MIDVPNISLNLHNRIGRQELYLVAAIWTVLQFGVVAYNAFTTYFPGFKLQKGTTSRTTYKVARTYIG